MGIRGGYCELSQAIGTFHNLKIIVDQVVPGRDHSLVNHKLVVAQRLDFKIIVKRCQFIQFLISHSIFHGLIDFSCLTGASDNQPFSVLRQNGSWKSWFLVEVIYMRIGNQLVKILQPCLVFGQKNNVICSVFLYIDAAVLIPGIFIRIEVSLHSVDDFNVFSLAIQLLCCICSIRKSLYHTVICYGNSRLPPGCSLFNKLVHLVKSVVVAHSCMNVELYPFLFPCVRLLLRKIWNDIYVSCVNKGLMFKTVAVDLTGNTDSVANRQVLCQLFIFLRVHEAFHAHCPIMIRYFHHQNNGILLFPFSVLIANLLAFHRKKVSVDDYFFIGICKHKSISKGHGSSLYSSALNYW